MKNKISSEEIFQQQLETKEKAKHWIGTHLTSSLIFGSRKNKENKLGMRLSTILLIGYRNIAVNKMRSILTIGGVGIGIGIITFLLSLGFGVQEMVIDEVTKNNPTNIIEISNENLENFVVLNDETVEKLKSISGVKDVQIKASFGGKFVNGESETDAVLNGVSQSYLTLSESKFSIESNENISELKGILITPTLAKMIGYENSSESIGKSIDFLAVIPKDISNMTAEGQEAKKETLTISGIINDKEKTTSIAAYALLQNLQTTFGIVAGQSGKILIHDGANSDSVRSEIEQMGLLTESVTEIVNDINSFFNVVRVILVIFGIIIMSISAMGMLNTLSISLLQRTKEVGILKALGMKRKDVFKMFIFEAILISFTGGAGGLIGGYLAAKGVNKLLNFVAIRQGVETTSFIAIPTSFTIAIIIFIVFLGFATGLLPARRASQTHALDALRYE